MATQISHVKIPPPRQLGSTETLQSLEQWYRAFRQYYKRDSSFKIFTLSTTRWDPTATNFAFTAEETGLKRVPAELKEDCIDFMHALAGYMPYGYLTEKFLSSVTSLQEAFNVICEHYGVNPSQESFLDFIDLQKNAGESYRQYHERMLAFARQHLTKENITVDGITSGARGDSLTISHMNLITLQWLRNINPNLVSIIKTEYSLELRQNTQLSALVPRISVNIDNLLSRYDGNPAVQRFQILNDDEDNEQATSIARVTRKNMKSYSSQSQPSKNHNKEFCANCFYLGDKLGISVNYDHHKDKCKRNKGAMVRMIQMEEAIFNGDLPMFPRPYVPKALCSQVLCSQGPMFPRSYVPKALCSQSKYGFGNIGPWEHRAKI